MDDLHTLLAADSELASLLPGPDGRAARRWLLLAVQEALGIGHRVPGRRERAAYARIARSPELTTRFVNYVTGTLHVFYGVEAASIAALRQPLHEAIGRCAAPVPRQRGHRST